MRTPLAPKDDAQRLDKREFRAYSGLRRAGKGVIDVLLTIFWFSVAIFGTWAVDTGASLRDAERDLRKYEERHG